MQFHRETTWSEKDASNSLISLYRPFSAIIIALSYILSCLLLIFLYYINLIRLKRSKISLSNACLIRCQFYHLPTFMVLWTFSYAKYYPSTSFKSLLRKPAKKLFKKGQLKGTYLSLGYPNLTYRFWDNSTRENKFDLM